MISVYNKVLIRLCRSLSILDLTVPELNLPHYILEESNFNFRYVRLCDWDIPREKWLNYLQTVETLIRCRILIWVCTVCRLPFYGSPDYNGKGLFSLHAPDIKLQPSLLFTCESTWVRNFFMSLCSPLIFLLYLI